MIGSLAESFIVIINLQIKSLPDYKKYFSQPDWKICPVVNYLTEHFIFAIPSFGYPTEEIKPLIYNFQNERSTFEI